MLQRYNSEMVELSRAKLALRETALAAAKIEKSELERMRSDDNLTGNHAACTLPTAIHAEPTTTQYNRKHSKIHRFSITTDEQRQALDNAIDRMPLWSVFMDYQKQYKATTKVYAKYNIRLPVGMWPQQKAPGAKPPPKPTAKAPTSKNKSYDDVVRRLELQAREEEDLAALRLELGEVTRSRQESAHTLEQRLEKRKLQLQQGYQHKRQMTLIA
jgi:hypothetical protein